jgi:hypothetical protein
LTYTFRRTGVEFLQGKRKEETGLLRVILVALSLVLCVPWSCPALAESAIHITFEGLEVGKPPPGWVSRNGNIGDVYTVQEEGGRKFLHADARGTAVQIGFESQWSLKEHPFLEWQWRALILPDKGDEMKKATNDSVLGLYVVFGRQPFIKTVKYVWSTTLPIGLSLESPFSSRTRMIVLESGDALLGKWVSERRDVLADYRHLFGGDPPVVRGIAILTDADNTASRASGDYGDIDILK